MNLSAQFKAYLLSLGSSASKVTVKNYVADVHKFIQWFESKYSRTFSPTEVSESTISAFKKDSLTNYSASSVDRSISSLRKFFTFLKLEGQISHSPFDSKPKAEEIKEIDPWRVKDFKNYLYVFNASHLTIKNYIIDLKQFISWAEEVLKSEANYEVAEANPLDQVDSNLLNEYKNRLLNEAKLSPVSVNRKLSSLRRYFSWAEEEGIIKSDVQVLNESSVKDLNENFGFQIDQDVAEATQNPAIFSQPAYSKIPPIRLAQKISRAGIMVADGILILPLVALAHKAEYGIWVLKGKPVIEAESAGILAGVLKSQAQPINKVKNVGKEFYAPAKVSLKYYPLHKKAIFHLKHTRPDWYKRYQNTSFVRFAQLAILAILFSALSYAVYSNLGPNKNQAKTFAALPSAPPRILSFQGRLTDTTDNPITSTTAIRMAIYDTAAASGSSLLWQEIVTVTPDSDGIFATLLGNNTTIPQSVFAQNSALWLGVSVGQTAELTPRQQIATVAFATNSETLQGLEPITNSASTSNVVLALNSSGNLSIGGSANPVFQSTGGSFTVQGTTLILSSTTGSGGNVRITPDGLGKIDLQKPLQNDTLTGNINTSRGAVEINDLFAILATSSGQSAFTLNQESTGPLISASTSGVAKFTVDNGGNLTAAGTINGLTVSNGTITSGTWNGTAISSTYGGTGINTSSSTGVPYISGGAWSVDANQLAANHGGTGIGSYTSGDLIYASGTSTLSKIAISGTNGLCLTSNGSAPSWGSCGAGTGTNWWTTSSDGKALTPINSTMDFLLGGQATTSAKFAFTGLANANSQTQATISGNLVLYPNNGFGGNAQIFGSSQTTPSLADSGNKGATLSLNSTTNAAGSGGTITFSSLNDNGTYAPQAAIKSLLSNGSQNGIGDLAFSTRNAISDTTLTERMRIAATGNVGIGGDTTPDALFSVGSTSQFQVNSSGAIAAATGIASSGTINFSGLSASSAVYTDGSKNLTTTAPTTGTIGYWSRSAQGALTPATLNDVVAATSSAYNPFTATTNNPAGTLTNNTLIQHIAAGTVTNLLTLSRTAGTVTTGLNLTGTIGTDISLQNGETISNNNDGTVAVTSPLTTLSGSARGVGDDTYFSWDYTTQRIGFTKKSGQTGKLTYGSANSFAIAQSNATDIAAANTFTDRFVIDSTGNISMGGVVTLANAAYTGNNAVIYGTVSTGQLAAATTSTSGQCLLSGAGAGFTPTWGTCPAGSSGTNWWTTSSDGKALTPINSTMDFLLGGQATTSAKFAFTGLSLANNQTQATLSGQLTVVPNNGYGGNASLAAQLTLGSFANPVIQTEKNQTLTIGGNKTGNINIAPLNGATGSNLTLTTINQTWTGTTTVTASSLTTLTTGATLAFSGDIRVNGNDILDSGGTSRITTGATTTLTNTTTTLSGTTTLTAASLATLTSSTTLSMNPNTGTTYTINTTGTTLNLFNTTAATFNFAGAATTFTLGGTTGTMSLRNPTINVANGGNAIIATTSNGNLTHTAAGTGQILLSADFNSGVQIATAVVSTPLAPLYINGGIGNNSAVIINQTNNGNILVASSAGTTRLTIDNTGNIDANSFITGSWTIDVNSPCNGSGRLCFSNGGTAEVSFTTGGQGRFTGGTVTDTPDYAENITVLDQSIESGDIVTSVIYDSTADSVYKKSTASKSIKAYQNEIIGGISENPGFLAAQGNSSSLPDDRPWTDSERPLTVAGRIPVKVTTQNGSINVGDRITSSDRPGIGMKATEAGQVVGIAMEPYSSPDPQEVKKILVFINPGFYDPDVVLTNSGDFNIAPTVDYNFEIQRNGENFTRIGGYSEIISAKIRGGFAEIQKISVQTITGVTGTFQNITTDTLAIATSNITIAGQSIQDFIASIVDQRIAQNQGEGNIISPLETDGDNVVIKLKTNDDKSKFVVKNASGSAVATIDGNGNASLSGQLNAAGASISGTLRADRIIANQIEGLNVQASTVSANYITNNYYISTPSGEVQNATPSGLFNQSATRSAMFGDLSAQTATFTQGLMSFGPSSFFEASIADRLFVGSQLSLADNSINVLGADLKIQPLRQGNVSFMAGLIKIDTDGNLNVGGNSYFAKDVEVKGKIAANIIAPLSGKDLVFQLNEDENNKVQFKNGTNSAFLSINNKGDINASGAGTFAKLNLDIVKEVQAVSDTEVIATGSAGLAEIKANREEVTINNKLVNEDSLIYITPKTAIPNNSVYLIRQVPGESFTVGISDTINKKVQFNWIIIN